MTYQSPTLWETACQVADATDMIGWDWRPGVHRVIAIFPTMADAMREQHVEREDIHLVSWGAPLLGRRCMNIVAPRGDFLEAWACAPTTDDLTVSRELHARRDWLMYSVMCRLLPEGRLILV